MEARGAFNASFVASASQSARAFWWFCGTFAGKFPAFVAVLVVLWNISRKIPGVCCCFGGFVEHLRENFRRLLLFWPFFGTFAGKNSGICCYFGGFLEYLPGDFPAFVATSADFWNILRSFFSGICCCFGRFLEHLREKLRHLLLFWPFFGTFAGEFPAFVAILVVFWNICRKIPGICCCFRRFLEHSPEIFLRRFRSELLSRAQCSAQAGRSVR